MNRPAIVHIIQFVLFIILLTGAFLLVSPVSGLMERAIDSTRDEFMLEFERATGLRLSYESISPSVIKTLLIKDIVVTDASNETVVARASTVSVSYSLPALLFGGVSSAIRGIVIENATVYVDIARNGELVARFRRQDASASEALPAVTQSASGPVSLADIVPRDVLVRIRNLDVRYVDRDWSASLAIRRGNALFADSGVEFDIDGSMRYDNARLSDFGPFSSTLSLTGEVNHDMTNGSASLSVSSLQGAKFSVSRIGLVTTYRNGVVRVNAVQDLQPVDLSVLWDTASGEVNARVECDRLLPLYWITPSMSLPSSLKDMSVSGKANLRVSGDGAMSYAAAFSVFLPDGFYGGGVGTVSVDGDEKTVNVRRISALGPRADIEISGSYGIYSGIPEGLLSVRSFRPRDGLSVTGDCYVQRSSRGFLAVIPELRVNDARFESIRFYANPDRVEGTEFSLEARDSRGTIAAEGTLATEGQSFFQGYLALDSIDAGNLAGLAGYGAGPSADGIGAGGDSGWGLTTELYVSSDMESLSFNCTRLVLASSGKESGGAYVLLSAKGTEREIFITDIATSPGIASVTGDIHAYLEGSGDVFFDADMSVQSIPYRLNGVYSRGDLSVYGDYGLAISIIRDPLVGTSGAFRVDGFPLPLGPLMVSLSLDGGFTTDLDGAWKAVVRRGFAEELNGFTPLSTSLSFAGTADPSGLFFHEMALTDSRSRLLGQARVGVFPDTGSGDRYSVDIDLSSADGQESFALSGNATRSTDVFLEGRLDLVNVPLIRFMKGQTPDNAVTASVTCSGTPETIFASVDIRSLSYRYSGHDASLRGSALLDDGNVVLSELVASWNGHVIDSAKGTLSLSSGVASFNAAYRGILDDSPVTTGLTVDLVPEPVPGSEGKRESFDFSRFTLRVSASDFRWNTIKPAEPFVCTLVREPGILALYAGPDEDITGFLLDDGTFSLRAGASSPVSFAADGAIIESEISVIVGDIRVDMPRLWPLASIGFVAFDSGTVEGELSISGLLSDPDFFGKLSARNLVVRSPGVFEERFVPEPFDIVAEGKTLNVETFRLESESSVLYANATAYFDRWVPTKVTLKTYTEKDRPLRVDTNNQYFAAKGRANCDLDLSFSHEGIFVLGNATFERGYFAIMFDGFSEEADEDDDSSGVVVDLSLDIGQRVEYRWPSNSFPILRGLIQADQSFKIAIDSANETFSLKGGASLKGGELFYIKRSFYLRQGSITFNENQDKFDPLISLRAEIRERDDFGDPVRIILLVENQPLASFTPTIYSDPPKPTAELMALLGQAASADSSRETLLRTTVITASDIFTQMGLFRSVENRVRDFLNVDIFSIRTLLLQNALLGQAMQEDTDRKMTIGNYFDNTTVYFGKYFGSAVYADALLHFSYYDPKSALNTGSKEAVYGNMLFEPELGLEIDTPFFLVRWAFAPDNLDSFFVGDSSITISWKFSY